MTVHPLDDRDAQDAASLVSGALLGLLLKYVDDPDRAIAIETVSLMHDDGGHRIVLTMRSGAILGVRVEIA